MRAVIQRVSKASVTIDGVVKGHIGWGFLILLGVCDEDTIEDVDWLVRKIANLRVFDDDNHVRMSTLSHSTRPSVPSFQQPSATQYRQANLALI